MGEGMKVYEGGRSLAGAVVTVDGKKLDPRFDLKRLSRAGFEWTYEGAGPAQLALALLADHFGDDRRALEQHDLFMREVDRQPRQRLAPHIRRYRRRARPHGRGARLIRHAVNQRKPEGGDTR